VSDLLRGHEPLPQRLNVRNELRRLKQDPMLPLLERLAGAERDPFLQVQDEFLRYEDAYRCYFLSLRRFLPEMSIAVRWTNGPRWKRRYFEKYTPSERRLAQKYHEVAPYLEIDFYACLLWARILMDRTIALSRHFLDEPDRPSFTSFNQHKKFFAKLQTPYGAYELYAEYIRERTEWFDEPLKLVRDKFIVHAAPQHMKIFGYPTDGHELGLAILVPAGDDPAGSRDDMLVMRVSIPRLARQVEAFLTWFADYGLTALPEQ